jgi:transcriptional regulator with XRE-family HTH domain
MNKNNLVADRIMSMVESKWKFNKDFAAHIDMKDSTLSDKLNGKTEITVNELYRFAEGLETTIEKLLGIEVGNTQHCHSGGIVLTQNNNGTIYFQPSQDVIDKLNTK